MVPSLIIIINIMIIIIIVKLREVFTKFQIQINENLAHNKPDLVVTKGKKQVWLVDVATPEDSEIEQTELEKITEY